MKTTLSILVTTLCLAFAPSAAAGNPTASADAAKSAAPAKSDKPKAASDGARPATSANGASDDEASDAAHDMGPSASANAGSASDAKAAGSDKGAPSANHGAGDPANPGGGATPAGESHPLEVRPAQALQLAPPVATDGLWWKAILLVVVGAAAFFVYRRKLGQRGALPAERLRVVGRAALGGRSEVVMVEVEGQRLLLAVSPGKVKRIARFDVPQDPAASANAAPFAATLQAIERRLKTSERESAEAPPSAHAHAPLALDNARDGQAKGLLRLASKQP